MTSLAEAIVAMPAAAPTPACAMVAVNLDEAVAQAVGHGAHIRWGGADSGSHCDQEPSSGQGLHHSHHFAP
jgi:hypothetical protein